MLLRISFSLAKFDTPNLQIYFSFPLQFLSWEILVSNPMHKWGTTQAENLQSLQSYKGKTTAQS